MKTKILVILTLLFSITANAKELELCKVTRIIDGDTIEVIYRGEIEKVRLWGIDTPERGEVGFKEASEFLRIFSENEFLFIDFPAKHKRDNFGRLLGNLYLHNIFLNKMMVENNYAIVYRTTKERLFQYETKSSLNEQLNYMIINNDIKSLKSLFNSYCFFFNTNIHKDASQYRQKLLNSTLQSACCKSNSLELIKTLVTLGADPNANYVNNITPLHAALTFDKDIEIIKFLVNKTKDLNIHDLNNNTPLGIAQIRNNKGAIIALNNKNINSE